MQYSYQRYFTSVHGSFPMMEQETFLSSLATPSKSPDVLALRHIMCAHVANSSPRFAAWAATGPFTFRESDYGSWFYQEARSYLEHSGKADESVKFSSIVAFQATVLIALYELRIAHFSRAWATMGDATWLAQMLQLHKLDLRDTSTHYAPLLPSSPLVSANRGELDEVRRALWAVLTLDCFMGIGIRWNIASAIDHNEVWVPTISRMIWSN
jgi:hypothetical protein